MKSIVLAEKPSVGKELARILKCTKKTKGYCEGSKYVVTWSLGHLIELAEPHDYDQKFKEWRMEDLPMLPEKMKLKIIKRTSHQYRTVQKLMKRQDIDELIIATDAGREGELVARWIMKLGGWRKPFKRLWISSQTDAAISQGFDNLKPGQVYDNLYQAARCRAEADWLIGLNITRALTCKFDAQLTAGRVQTPTLSMIVDREKEIKKFEPVDFWTIQADFGDYFGHWRDKNGSGRLFDRAKAESISEKTNNLPGLITDVTIKSKSEPPPLAYDLTELQRDANRQYNFSAKKTLSMIQRLYEHYKLVTYPRTDSRYITTDMVNTLPQRLRGIHVRPYKELVSPLLSKQLSPGKRLVNNSKVSDHHAIIPTEQILNFNLLTNDERKVYDLIVERFIAVLYPPYRYDQITIITVVNGQTFYSRGKIVRDKGWRAVMDKRGTDEEDPNKEVLPEQTLRQPKKGKQVHVKSCKIRQSQTGPPSRYTEATLLTAMESPGKFITDEELRESIKVGGLGTPATRAEIIEKLLDNYYIERQAKSLVPTSKGKQLIDLVPTELKSPELTARWELRLSNIAKGNERNRSFIADIRKNAVALVKNVREDTSTYKVDNLTGNACPMCGQAMLSVNTKKGKKLVCSDRRCGCEEFENPNDSFGNRRSRKESGMNKRLISQYSDHAKGGTSLGELLKASLEKKNKLPE